METTTTKKKTEAVESIGPHGTRGGTCAAPLVLLLACSCCAITLTLTALAAMKLHCFTRFAIGVREMQVHVRVCGCVVGLAMFVSASHAAAVAIHDRLSFESSRSAAPAPHSTHESQELLNRESGSEEGENVALAEAAEGGASGGDDRSDASSTVTMVPDATRFVVLLL
jgi:hypothetical protein